MAEETADIIETPLPTARAVEADTRDLGFGAVVARESRQRFLNKDGSFNVQRTGRNFLNSLNLYHTLITMSWKVFLGLVLLLYFSSNIFFGLLYSGFGADAIVDTSSTPMESIFIRSFFFSVQTFATIGYGTIHPVGIVPNLLVTIESYYSLLANALITGLVFARFARPTARVIYSRYAVVAPYRGIKGLMFRIVNGRNNQLFEMEATVLYSRFVNENGARIRRFDNLELERNQVNFLPLAWTIVHPIGEASPLCGITQQELVDSEAEFLVLLKATDETFASVVHTRSSYKADEIKVGYKFARIYNEIEEDEPISIDVRKLSVIEEASIEPRRLQ